MDSELTEPLDVDNLPEKLRAYAYRFIDLLSNLDSIDLTKIPTDSIAYGSRVVLYDLEKEVKVSYKLVTSEESDPDNGLISTVSPIGQALMGREEGDEVKVKTPTGFRNFEITRLRTIHDGE